MDCCRVARNDCRSRMGIVQRRKMDRRSSTCRRSIRWRDAFARVISSSSSTSVAVQIPALPVPPAHHFVTTYSVCLCELLLCEYV